MAEFYTYVEAGAVLKRILRESYGQDLPIDEVYIRQAKMLVEAKSTNGLVFFLWEAGWWSKAKPYYRVYPKMVNAMCRLNIDKVMANEIHPPNDLTRLLVELPKGNQLMDDKTDVRFMFIDWLTVKTPASLGLTAAYNNQSVEYDKEKEDIRSQLAIGIHYGEMDVGSAGSLPLWDIWRFPLSAHPVGDQLGKMEHDEPPESVDESGLHRNTVSERRRLTSLALTLMMLEDDPDIVLPDVLAADRHKANKGNRDKLADKARRRGRNGWTIGEEIEYEPHTRVPHMATFHVGEGRKKTIVKRRKGSIVHREKVVKTPTGYKGTEGESCDD